MGTLRFILAAMVAASHAGASVHGFNPGVVAVAVFFLISGYVMTLLIGSNFDTPERYGAFLCDRAARLFPQFLVYLTIAVGLYMVGRYSGWWSQACGPSRVAVNYSMIALGYNYTECILLPPTWSLGLEASFYLIAPLAVSWVPRRFRITLFAASAAVFCLALSTTLNPDTWGYRLLPGTLFIFLTGAAMARPDLMPKNTPAAVWVTACVTLIAVALWAPGLYGAPYTKEVLAGLILGIPTLGIVKSVAEAEWSRWAGNLSYGFFLNHWIAIALVGYFDGGAKPSTAIIAFALLASVVAADISYRLFEAPALRWRRSLRTLTIPNRATHRAVQPSCYSGS